MSNQAFEQLVGEIGSRWSSFSDQRDLDLISGDPNSFSDLFNLVLETAASSGVQMTPRDLRDLEIKFNLRDKRHLDFGALPPLVIDLFEAFLAGISPDGVTSVLDLWTKPGSMLEPLVRIAKPAKFISATRRVVEKDWSEKFLPPDDYGEYTYLGEVEARLNSGSSFDVITGFPPPNLGKRQQIEINGQALRVSEEIELLLRASVNLSDEGFAFFILPQGQAEKWSESGAGWQKFLPQLGLNLSALVRLPERTFEPYTNISMYLVILRKVASDKQFWAEASEANLEKISENYFTGSAAEDSQDPRDGVWRVASELHSSKQIKKEHLIEWRKSQDGLPDYEETSLADLCISIHRLRGSPSGSKKNRTAFSRSILADFESSENLLYLRPSPLAQTRSWPLIVTSDPDEVFQNDDHVFPVDHPVGQHWYLLELDPERAIAPFMEKYLTSEFGEMGSTGDYKAKEYLDYMSKWRVWIPPVETQIEVTYLDTEIRTTLRSYEELQENLWKRIDPRPVKEQMKSGTEFHELSLANWSDSLPLPLATALWAYAVEEEGSATQSTMQLDWFFETLISFMGILYLSALKSDSDQFLEIWPEVQNRLRNDSFENPTIGTWITIIEKLAKAIRVDLDQSEARDKWSQAFACSDLDFLRALTSKQLVSLLKKANEYRNLWRGHGAPPDQAEAQNRRHLYSELLIQFREIVGTNWSDYPLVFAQSSIYQGGIFTNSVDLAMGSRVAMKKVTLETLDPLEHRTFNFVDPVSQHRLQLLPFLQEGAPAGGQPGGIYLYSGIDKKTGSCKFNSCSHPESAPTGALLELPEILELVGSLSPGT